MSDLLIIVVSGIFASIFFGVFSNYLYDLMKLWGFFPEKPSVKNALVLIFISVPFFILILLPELSPSQYDALLLFLKKEIPLWVIFLLVALTITVCQVVIWLRLRSVHLNLSESRELLKRTQESLIDTQRKLNRCLETGTSSIGEPIIKP